MHGIKRIALVTAALFLMAAGAVVNGAQLYFMAALLLCLPCVSYVVARQSLRTIHVARDVPASGWEDEVATFHLVISSRSPLPKLMLQMRDNLPAWLEQDPHDDGYFDLPASTELRLPYAVRLAKRGLYQLGDVSILAHDPLGLFTISRTWHARAELVVYPVPQPLPSMSLVGSDRYGSFDVPHTVIHGSGTDPDGVRQYQAGDSLRRIHWKSLARTGALNVVEFEEDLLLHVVMVLDTTAGVDPDGGPDSAFEYLVRMAASLGEAAVCSGATFRLIAGPPHQAEVSGRGRPHLFSVLDSLARVSVDSEGPPISRELFARIGAPNRGASIVLLTAETDPALPAALARYAAAGVQVTVVYADSRTFDLRARAPAAATQRAFVDALLASQVSVYLLGRDEGRRLAPERLHGSSVFV